MFIRPIRIETGTERLYGSKDKRYPIIGMGCLR